MSLTEALEHGLRRHFEGFPGPGQRFGYKVAFNPQAVQARLGLDGALVAGLRGDTLLPDGASFPVARLRRPVLEAEVVARLGADVAVGAGAAAIAAAVDAIGPAIELVDFDRPLEQLPEILAEGVFHRAVVLGPLSPPPFGASLRGLGVRVRSEGARVFAGDAEQATGLLTDVLGRVAYVLGEVGQRLCAGDHVILGSMAPPVEARPGGRFELRLSGFGRAALFLT